MTTKLEWVAAIESLVKDWGVSKLAMHLMSPQFTYGNWRIGAEHQRSFRTAVLGWRHPDAIIPPRFEDWEVCSPSDQKKGWNYRLPLVPHELPILLSQLDSLERPSRYGYQEFEERVRSSRRDSPQDRERRLKDAPRFPPRIVVTTMAFDRNPDVVAQTLQNAAGKCQSCGKAAPFQRRSDGTPYLEVHHKKPLSEGGEDTVENAVALCPNCHRRMHFGP